MAAVESNVRPPDLKLNQSSHGYTPSVFNTKQFLWPCFQMCRYISHLALRIYRSGRTHLLPFAEVCVEFFSTGGLSIDRFIKYSKGWVSKTASQVGPSEPTLKSQHAKYCPRLIFLHIEMFIKLPGKADPERISWN